MRRCAFTLVELLIVMTIIGILVTISMGAVWLAQESARAERTQATIHKLHNVVIDRWESYRTRRLAITVPTPSPADRLTAIRDAMRMEMPDRYEDLLFDPQAPSVPPNVVAATGIRHTYLRRIDAARKLYNTANGTNYTTSTAFIQNVLATSVPPEDSLESAECLYMFITASMPADERAEFRDKDHADTNGNFMPEFVDGWGKPIRWLRWAPGFASDVQIFNPIEYHDAFDPYGLQAGDLPSSLDKGYPASALYGSEAKPQFWGYNILPLIYSAGPDSYYGIRELITNPPTDNTMRQKNRFPYAIYGGYQRGDSMPFGTDTVHYDNIHNHLPQGQ